MEEQFTHEPVIGHYVGAEVYRPESSLSDTLDRVAEEYDIPRSETRRVRITVGDVDWEESTSLSIDLETFEKLIDWYQND